MQELRTDELTGTCVIVAPGRATRPVVYSAPAAAPTPGAIPDSCPFCPGHETMTPPELARVGTGEPDTSGWQVRVVPNLYPIVGQEPGIPGAHDVIVMSPAHDRQLDALSLDEATATLLTLRDRAAHYLEAGFVHAQPLVNHGRASGASIEHPHAQLVAIAFVPPNVDAELTRFAEAGRDLVVDAIDEARRGPLLVHDGAAISWCPKASTSPFFVRIAGLQGNGRFDNSTDEEVRALTDSIRDALARLHRVLGELAYNVVVNTAPRDDPRPFHCWIDIVPRLGVVGGFELGTGLLVNPVAPETTAQMLRDRVNLFVGTTISATPADVWQVIEPIERHVDWMTDAKSITFTSAARRGVGTRFDCRTKIGPLRTTDRMRVTEWIPGEVMGIEHVGVVTGSGHFTLIAREPRSTMFIWSEDLTFPWWMGGAVGAFAAAPILRAVWNRNLRNLKRLVEHPV